MHGQEVLQKKNAAAAICSDCHTTHEIDLPEKDAVKLVITKNCGSCHKKSYESYRQTYHGQVMPSAMPTPRSVSTATAATPCSASR